MGKALTEEEYDKRIAIHGKAVRVDPFRGTKFNILHMCLKHGEEHLSNPGHTLRGHGMSCCRSCLPGNRDPQVKYDKELNKYGKVKRVGDYEGNYKKILHTCLIHSKNYFGLPYELRKGGVLICCAEESSRKTPTKIFNEEERLREQKIYDQILKSHGRVKRVENYVNRTTKITHRCLIHGENHPGVPTILIKGGSIRCCLSSISKRDEAKKSYDKKLEKYGKVRRIGEYIDANTPILHLCLRHGELHKALPGCVTKGQGLNCCNSYRERNRVSRSTYDDKISKFGRVIRIGEYIDCYTKILHKCLVHDEIHYGIPNNILNGGGLSCCRNVGFETIYSLLIGNKPVETYFYAFYLSNYQGRVKIGISSRVETRSKDPEYGDLISQWLFSSRLEAYLVEQACLNDILLKKDPPLRLKDKKWPGYSEIVLCDEDFIVKMSEFYIEKLNSTGPYRFILDFLNPCEQEKQICICRLEDEGESLFSPS